MNTETTKWVLELSPEDYRHFQEAIDKERQMAKRMVLEEREAIAAMVENTDWSYRYVTDIAAAIRARAQ